MKNWQVFAAAIGIITAMWAQIKNILGWLRNFVVVTVHLDDTMGVVVASHLQERGRSNSRIRLFSGSALTWIKSLNRNTTIVWECLTGSSRTFWLGWRPVWYVKDDKPVSVHHKHSFSFVRGTLNWEKLMLEAADSNTGVGSEWAFSYSTVRHKVVYHFGKNLGAELTEKKADAPPASDTSPKSVYAWGMSSGTRLLGWDPAEIGRPHRPARFNDLSLSQELVSLGSEMKRWLSLKDWYAERGVPWRRGYLFEGAPGTGKTAFARAAAEELDLPVHVFDLAGMSNHDLREEWGKMLKDTPCMVVLEDIDGVFQGRQNVSPSGGMLASGGLTFDALLNCIDGVERTNGVLLVVTTNHPEHVDDALAKRPGRIDRTVEFKPLDLEGRVKLARRIIGDGDRAVRIATENRDVAASRFVELCCRAALEGLYDAPQEGPYR